MSAPRAVLPTYTDARYNEAVGRLRFLLQEYDSSSHAGSETGSSRHAPQSDASQHRDRSTERIPHGERPHRWQWPEQSRSAWQSTPGPQHPFSARQRVVRILEPPQYIPEHDVGPAMPTYFQRPEIVQAELAKHEPMPRPRPLPWNIHMQSSSTLRRAGPINHQPPHPRRRTPSPKYRQPALVDAQTSPAPSNAHAADPMEAETSTTELLTVDSADTRQLREATHRQHQLLSQLDQENSALREMMNQLQENVQTLVQENRRLSEELLAQTNLTMTAAVADRLSDRHMQNKDSSPENQNIQPEKESSSMVCESHNTAGDIQIVASLQERLEKSQNEILKLKSKTEEHEQWLSGAYKDQLDKHKEEKTQLNEALGKLQTRVSELQSREEDALQRVSESISVVDQARLEQAQAENSVSVLRRQLKEQQDRIERDAAEQERRMATARDEAERAVHDNFQRQATKLKEQAERIASLEEDQQRWKSAEKELRASMQRQQTATETARLDAERVADKQHEQLAQQQRLCAEVEARLATAVETTRRSEQASLQATEAFQTEIASLHKQLGSTETALSAAQADRVRLQEQVNTLVRETSDSQLALTAAERSGADDVRQLQRQAEAREQQLMTAAEQERAITAARLEQLEALLHSQEEVGARLQAESSALADQLAESELARRQLAEAQQLLEERLAETEAARRRLEVRCYEFGRQHEQHLQRAERLERQLADSMQAAQQLADQHQRLLDERRMLHARIMLQSA